MDDFVVQVRQIMEYPLKGAADPGDAVLMQTGGLGGPYVWTTAYGVAQALGGPDGQVGVGVPLPGDAVGTGVIASNFIAPSPGCNVGWNFYQNSFGGQSFLGPGAAGLWCFNGSSLAFVFTAAGAAGQPIAEPPPVLNLDNTGYLDVANTVLVQRDPVAPTEVATKQYVDAEVAAAVDTLNARITAVYNELIGLYNTATVWSFQGRTGAVSLLLSDVTGVGGAPIFSPAFYGVPTTSTPPPNDGSSQIPTTSWVGNFVAAFVDDNIVESFNGRTGVVNLLLSDITNAGGASIYSPFFVGDPRAPTPPFTDNSTRLATTAWGQYWNSSISMFATGYTDNRVNTLNAQLRALIADIERDLTIDIERIVRIRNQPPVPTRQGDLWWDSSKGKGGGNLFIWYDDGTSSQWVVANRAPPGPPGPPGKTRVIISEDRPERERAEDGELWWQPGIDQLYYFDDEHWKSMLTTWAIYVPDQGSQFYVWDRSESNWHYAITYCGCRVADEPTDQTAGFLDGTLRFARSTRSLYVKDGNEWHRVRMEE